MIAIRSWTADGTIMFNNEDRQCFGTMNFKRTIYSIKLRKVIKSWFSCKIPGSWWASWIHQGQAFHFTLIVSLHRDPFLLPPSDLLMHCGRQKNLTFQKTNTFLASHIPGMIKQRSHSEENMRWVIEDFWGSWSTRKAEKSAITARAEAMAEGHRFFSMARWSKLLLFWRIDPSMPLGCCQ